MTKGRGGDDGGEWKRIVDGGGRRCGGREEKGRVERGKAREGKGRDGMGWDGWKCREFSRTRSLARSDVGWFVAAAADSSC